MRDFELVYFKYNDQGLRILALYAQQDRVTASRFAKRLNITYDILLDIQGMIVGEYQIIGLPTTLLLTGRVEFILGLLGNLQQSFLNALSAICYLLSDEVT